MNNRAIPALGLLLFTGGMSACSDSVGPLRNWEVSFEVSPEEMSPEAAFTATLSISNTLEKPRELTAFEGCVSRLSVPEAPLSDPVHGTIIYCTAAPRSFKWDGGETRTWSWGLAAETESGEPLAAGEYRLRAELLVLPERPEAVFRVTGDG